MLGASDERDIDKDVNDKNAIKNEVVKNISRKKVFRSRISILLIVFVLAIFILVSMPIIKSKAYPGMYVLGGTFFILMFLFTGIRYIISGSKMLLKIWFIPGWSVDIVDIRSVERSYNMISSPAGSLKRLCVNFRVKDKFTYLLISPICEKEFIKELKSVNPNISIQIPYKKGLWRILDWDI